MIFLLVVLTRGPLYSPSYLCDIEQGRRCAPDGDFTDRLSECFEQQTAEHERFLDLAARSRDEVPADLPDYIMGKEMVRSALRAAKNMDATDDEWRDFIERLENRPEKE